MTQDPPRLVQVNLVVRDMAATLAFYRRLGLELPDDAGPPHVEVPMGDGFVLEFDDEASIALWDTGWRREHGGANVLGFVLASRAAVDACYTSLVEAGHRAHQPPYDAFFGARYAIVEDPDGNPVGLRSPLDETRRSWPPGEAPPALG